MYLQPCLQTLENLTEKELVGVGKAGSIAEEAILGVRTVQAFNGQDELVNRYEEELSKGKRYGIIKSVFGGLSGGGFTSS